MWTRFPLAALLTGCVASASQVTVKPLLALADSNPVVVEGHRFAAKERVTLRTSIDGKDYEVTVEADADGSFKAQIAEVDAECRPFQVSAAGDKGSKATTPKRVPPPCGAPIQP
jgi:hypothetical protein